MHRFLLLLLCSIVIGCMPSYDVIIRGGQVYDGIGNPVSADIGIRNQRIARITSSLKGTADLEIFADDLAVAPGFIDLHAHLEPLPLYPDAKSHVMQGVTTAFGGPDGSSPFPIAAYLDSLGNEGVGLNVGYLIGHNTVRNHIMGLVNRDPTHGELDSIKTLIRAAIDQGAFGVSTGLKYLPGTFAKTAEIIAIAKVASDQGGIYTSHLREEGLGLIDGVKEAIMIGRESGITVVLTHHKVIGQPMWGASVQTLALVDSARSEGID
ncbi:MAG: D-aminoacylase, partial [Saprospiraceae bacterium]|nr:D-aminoacylase [Saprospiraceae bacterium]